MEWGLVIMVKMKREGRCVCEILSLKRHRSRGFPGSVVNYSE